MANAVEDEAFVELVGIDQEIVPASDLAERFQALAWLNRAGRVVR